MSYVPLVTVNGTALPEPSKYNGTTSTLVNSGRNVLGYVVGAVIRDDVGKVEMSWNFLTTAQWAGILQLFSPTYGGSFYNDVTFFDQVSNSWITREMYVSDRSAGIFKRNSISGSIDGYTGAKLSLVEV